MFLLGCVCGVSIRARQRYPLVGLVGCHSRYVSHALLTLFDNRCPPCFIVFIIIGFDTRGSPSTDREPMFLAPCALKETVSVSLSEAEVTGVEVHAEVTGRALLLVAAEEAHVPTARVRGR